MLDEMVKIVENFTPKERKRVQNAYRKFLKNFDCEICPCIDRILRDDDPKQAFTSGNDLYEFVVRKQKNVYVCELCHGFPILMPKHDIGCPCKKLGARVAKNRLKKLVASWE